VLVNLLTDRAAPPETAIAILILATVIPSGRILSAPRYVLMA
jgi:hypothetical protein